MSDNSSEKIKLLRKQKRFTQDQLAHELGVSRQTIFAIETGRSEPSLPLAIKLCGMLDTAIEDIFDDFFPSNPPTDNTYPNFMQIGGEVNEVARNLIPLSPLSDLTDLHREIDRFFEDSVSAPRINSSVGAVNIKDKSNEYVVHVSVSGFTSDEIDIEVNEDTLVIKGNKKEEEKDSGEGWLKREFTHSNFERSIILPSSVISEKTTANARNGELIINLPKSQPSKPRSYKVQIGS